MTQSQKPASSGADDIKDKDPKYTIVIIGEDGGYYKLTYNQWHNLDYQINAANNDSTAADTESLPSEDALEANAAAAGAVSELEQIGSYLAFIPPKSTVGIGYACTVVNLKSILKGQA